MIVILDIFTFLIGAIYIIKVIKSLIKGKYNFYSLLVIVFFFFQFVPLIFDNIYSDHLVLLRSNFEMLYKAMSDQTVSVVYDLVIIFVISILFYKSTKVDNVFKKHTQVFDTFKNSSIIKLILLSIIFFPLLLIFFAPDPGIYLIWAYPFRFDMGFDEELYHQSVIMPAQRISLFALVAYYAQKRKSSILLYLGIFFITWISFKRTSLVFISIIIVAIDYFKGTFKKKPIILVKKTMVFILICISYFIIYGTYTGKHADSDPYASYTLYYSREYCLKTAIYDQLYTNKMLDYRGQTFLFDLFFWVPRNYWSNKPAMFSKYFTAYSQGNFDWNIGEYVTNIYVNIWTEFVANFHLFGIILAIIFIHLSTRFLSKQKESLLYLIGHVFLIFYFFWGIQPFMLVIISLWFILYLFYKIKRTTKVAY